MGLEETISTLRDLAPTNQVQAADFIAYLKRQESRTGAPRGQGEAVLDAIAADPVARERFAASIERAMEEMDRGAGSPLDEVAARLRERSRARRAE